MRAPYTEHKTKPLLAATELDRVLFRSAEGSITGRNLLVRVSSLTTKLPVCDGAAISFERRDAFATALLSVWSRGQTAMLPASVAERSLDGLSDRLGNIFYLSDRNDAGDRWGSVIIDSTLSENFKQAPSHAVDPALQAICMFTSGSTGSPAPNLKSWGTLQASALPIADMIGLDRRSRPSIVATVPCDHMYGFELTILLVLYAGVSAHCERTAYPDEVARCLNEVPAPRVLVSTPFHLRLLVESGVSMPSISRVISATAPLSGEFAAELEERFDAPVHEIYGFTEAGSVASRRTIDGARWTLRSDLTPFDTDGRQFLRIAGSGEAIPFPDTVHIVDDSHIELGSRNQDIVKVAGKRESLANLSSSLCQIEGVEDGVYVSPPEDFGKGAISRPIVLVVAPGVTDEKIREQLRRSVDPVFLPRRIFRVRSLPRNETGKLPQANLRRLVMALLRKDDSAAEITARGKQPENTAGPE